MNRLAPGERMIWNSKDRAHTVIVQRTDAGQTWSVTQLYGGHIVLLPDGGDARWAYAKEENAMEHARFLAEALRGLVSVPVKP